MKRVLVQDNRDRNTVIVEGSATIAEVIERAGFPVVGNGANLNGMSLTAGDMAKTLDELGAPDSSWISLVAKMSNAA